MVQRIQRLSAELQIDTFRDSDRTEQAQVHVEEPGSAENISARGSEPLRLAGRNIDRRKGGAVEILIGRRIGSGGKSAFQVIAEDLYIRLDQVRHLRAAWRVQISGGTLDDIERRAAHGAQDAARLESSHDLAEDAFVGKLLPMAERQLPEPVQLEVMGAVIARDPSVEPRRRIIL